jgi:hypothetical protein
MHQIQARAAPGLKWPPIISVASLARPQPYRYIKVAKIQTSRNV